MPKRNVPEELAQDLLDWLERATTEVAEAILGSALSPQVVRTTTRAEQLAYYRTQMYLPDGSPNLQGRADLMARVGADGYEKVALAVAGDGAPPQEAY